MSSVDFRAKDPLKAEASFSPDRINGLMADLTEVAAMAYGSGIGEGIKGGQGHIGVLNGKVIKFNTKSAERAKLGAAGAAFDEMKAASDTLRNRLATAVDAAARIVSSGTHGFKVDQNLAAFKTRAASLLGIALTQSQDEGCGLDKAGGGRSIRDFSNHYRMLEGRGLLTRAVAAQTVTLIRDFLRQHAPDQAPLVKNHATGDTVELDLNVWRKVKDMRNLKSQDVRGEAHFDYFKEMTQMARQVEAIKCSVIGGSYFAAKLREAGNKEMGARFSDVLVDQAAEFNRTVLKIGGKRLPPMQAGIAEGVLRGYRVQALAASMDKMFAEMKGLYRAHRQGAGHAFEPSQTVRNLGDSPFASIFEEAIGEIRGRSGKGYDYTDPFWSLTENESRNLLALMRNKALAFVVAQDNELVRNPETGKTSISEETMLVKDLFLSCARLFDRDADHHDCSKLVEERELNGRLDDGTTRHFARKEVGQRYFLPEHWSVFTMGTYGADEALAQPVLQHEQDVAEHKKTMDAVADELLAAKRTFESTQGDEVEMELVRPQFAQMVKGLVQKYAAKLATIDRTNVAEIAKLRRTFAESLANCLPNASMDSRTFTVDEEGGEKTYTFQQLRLKEIGDFFEARLVAAFAKKPAEE